MTRSLIALEAQVAALRDEVARLQAVEDTAMGSSATRGLAIARRALTRASNALASEQRQRRAAAVPSTAARTGVFAAIVAATRRHARPSVLPIVGCSSRR